MTHSSVEQTELAGDADHMLVVGLGGSRMFPEVVVAVALSDAASGAPALQVVDTRCLALTRLVGEPAAVRALHIAASCRRE